MSVCIFSIVLCLVSLSAVTWAWYTADVSSQENIIHSTAYRPNVGIYCVEEVVTLASDATEATTIEARVAQANGVGTLEHTLVRGKQYEVTIHASGDVKTGYYQITLGDKTYYTDQIAIGCAMSVALSVDQDTVIKMTPLWGVGNQNVSLVDGGEYHVLAGELCEGQGTLTEQDPPRQDPTSSDERIEPDDTSDDEPEDTEEPENSEGNLDPAEPIEPTETPDGTDTPADTEEPENSEGDLDPVEPIEPTETPDGTDTPADTEEPENSEGDLDPVEPIEPTETPDSTDTPADTEEPENSEGDLDPAEPIEPTETPDGTDTPADTEEPENSEGDLDPAEPTDAPDDSDVTVETIDPVE